MINKQANIKGQEFLLEAWRREGGHQSAGVGAGRRRGRALRVSGVFWVNNGVRGGGEASGGRAPGTEQNV